MEPRDSRQLSCEQRKALSEPGQSNGASEGLDSSCISTREFLAARLPGIGAALAGRISEKQPLQQLIAIIEIIERNGIDPNERPALLLYSLENLQRRLAELSDCSKESETNGDSIGGQSQKTEEVAIEVAIDSASEQRGDAVTIAPDILDPHTPINDYFKLYQKNKSISLRNALMLHFRPLVETLAHKFLGRVPASITWDELVSEGMSGLMEAIEGFDPSRKFKFSTYAGGRIVGSMLDYCRSVDPFARAVRNWWKKVERSRNSLQNALGRSATEEELAECMNMSPDAFFEQGAKWGSEPIQIQSIHDVISNKDVRMVFRQDLIPDPESARALEKIEARDAIEACMRGFSELEREVVIAYYFDQISLREIGERFDLSESRISQLTTDLFDRLRDAFSNRPAMAEFVSKDILRKLAIERGELPQRDGKPAGLKQRAAKERSTINGLEDANGSPDVGQDGSRNSKVVFKWR